MSSEKKIKLTIIIPTYNRKERLKRTLELLDRQTDSDFEVIISDNCSNYDISEIVDQLKKEFSSRIKLIKNKINLGMDLNFTLPFLQIEEGWIWQVADDDEPLIDAVYKIKRDILLYYDKAWITYPVFDCTKVDFSYHEFNSLTEYIDFYYRCSLKTTVWGDLAYIGNKIYNYRCIRELIPDYIQYSYTRLSNIVLFILSLDKGYSGAIINDKVIAYDNSAGIEWNTRNVCLGTRVFQDIELNIPTIAKKRFYSLISPNNWLIKYTIKSYMKQHKTLIFPGIGIDVVYQDLIKRYLPWNRRLKIKILVMISSNPFCYSIARKILLQIRNWP